ncbi:MAG: ABC transporter ATP-binding protein [Pseudomonadota bacterium]
MNVRDTKPDDLTGNNLQWGKRNTAGVSFASSLSFDDVSHDYGNGLVLKNVNLDVDPGEVLCLLGPSGSGKSTILRIAAGIERPTSGSVSIDEDIVAGNGVDIPPEKRGIGLVFQDFALFPHLTIRQNVLFGLTAVPADIAREEAQHLLSRVGMASMADLYPHQISGGEQQRIALARALAPRPGILLMDEPFSGLDARLRDNIRDETISLLRDTRSTSVIVTHDPEEALLVADRIALMNEGQIVQLGTGADLYDQPASLFVARFFSQLNIFYGKVSGGKVETIFGAFPATNLTDGQSAAVCLRLQDIKVSPHKSSRTGRANNPAVSVPGRILSRRFLGIADRLEIAVEGIDEPIKARIRAGSLPAEAMNVDVGLDQKAAMIFSA